MVKVSKIALYQLSKYFIKFLATANDVNPNCILDTEKFVLEENVPFGLCLDDNNSLLDMDDSWLQNELGKL